MAAINVQSRKFNITINNPQDAKLDWELVDKTFLETLKPQYYVRSEEIGEEGTRHFHIAIYRPSPIRFNTIKRLFPTAHIERAYGTMKENQEYIKKGGKWVDTDKADTVVPGTFAEFGDMPTEQEEKAPIMANIMEELGKGTPVIEILTAHPELALQVQKLDALGEALRADKVAGLDRGTLDVTYIYGKTGTGKTKGIYDKHSARDICRITSYGKGGIRFDSYHGQDVLVFEEFASQVPLSDMLNYLDRYPLMLPARYADRPACYTKVYITSNLSLEEQYKDEQEKHPERWAAFLRRITRVLEYREKNNIITHEGVSVNYEE